jgi:hypothetical protein
MCKGTEAEWAWTLVMVGVGKSQAMTECRHTSVDMTIHRGLDVRYEFGTTG